MNETEYQQMMVAARNYVNDKFDIHELRQQYKHVFK